MKKRTLSLLVVSAICVLFAGCGNSSSATPDSASKKSEVTTTIEQTTTLAPTTVAPTTVPPTTVHTHQWEDITSTVHHEAVKEQVWVVDKPASTIECMKMTLTCSYCNKQFFMDSGEDSTASIELINSLAENHLTQCREIWEQYQRGSVRYPKPRNEWDYSTYPQINPYKEYYNKEIAEQGHYENQTTKEAYDETIIIGQKCKTCGEYQTIENKQNN